MDRSKIDNKYKWKLEDLYKDIKEYEKDITLLNNLVEEFKKPLINYYEDKNLDKDMEILKNYLEKNIIQIKNTSTYFTNSMTMITVT